MKPIDRWYDPKNIIDAHVHLPFQEMGKNIKFWSEEMENNKVDQMVLLMSREKHFEVIHDHLDKFIPFCWIGGKPDLSLIERYYEDYGLKGLKLYPCLSRIHPQAEEMYPIYEFAEKKRLIITVHMGFSSAKQAADMSLMNPELFLPILKRYERLVFLFAHFAPGYFQEFLRLLYQFRNVYAETSSSNNWIEKMAYSLSLEDVFQKVINIGGFRRIIFGTDSLDKQRGWRKGIYQRQLSILNEFDLDQEAIDAIFGGNIRELVERVKKVT